MDEPGLSRADEKLLVALRRRKEREARSLFLAEGVRVAEEFLDAGIVLRLAVYAPTLEDTARGRALALRLADLGARKVSDASLQRLAATDSPQGVLLVGEIPAARQQSIEIGSAGVALVLDAVQDPGNIGTLVRAADAFRAAAVVALPGTVDAWNPKAVRAAAGSSFRVPILNLSDAVAQDWLRERGCAIVVADAAGAPIGSGTRSGPVALVVGNEGAGVRPEWLRAASDTVAVPTPGPVESLNVAVATGILLYVLTRDESTGND